MASSFSRPKFSLPSSSSSFAQYSAMAISLKTFLTLSLLPLLASAAANGQLSPSFYNATCPNLQPLVRSAMSAAILNETRMGASIIRLFFHDCFVNGCDGSILLDDTPIFTGEKTAPPNRNSVRGFEVVDDIKSLVEASCPATVSCADILALAARDAVVLLGGPDWEVWLGRRDSRTASFNATADLPAPSFNLDNIIASFAKKGLSQQDMVALSGAHTVGFAQCTNFRHHIYLDADIDAGFAAQLQGICPRKGPGGDRNLAPLEVQHNGTRFSNDYYKNLLTRRGLLHSDQGLFTGRGSADSLVLLYALVEDLFFAHFAEAMVKMGNLTPLTGASGEVRINCSKVN